MSTRRSLTLTVCGVALLALAGSAAAQAPDTTAATVVPAADSVTEIMLEAGYDSVDLTWSVPATYRTTCRIGATGGGAECVAAETPLTGFTVYYSIQAFGTRTALGVMSKDTSGGALTDGTGVYELTGLDPETTYFATIVARNAFGPANIVAASVANTTTTAAPVPEQVARVEVTSGEDMKVTASWDAPRPDKDANRTNHTIAMYNVQYRTSQTVTNSPGAWMPTKPHGGDRAALIDSRQSQG